MKTEKKRGFGSDNHSGVHPRFWVAMANVDALHEPSYQTDSVSAEADEMFKRHFGANARAYYVFNGTAANVIALGALVQSHNSIICTSHAHIAMDECGAPEKAIGCKLVLVDTPDGKLTLELIKAQLIRRGDQHFSQVKAISITQPTEIGTLYTRDEIRAITELARREKLFVHMDGARFVNACEALGVSFGEITTDLGVDVLSLGGTKNGMLFGEAILVLNRELGHDLKFTRKQLMHLPSKTRYLAAQFIEFLDTDLWRENANHANQMAQRLSKGLNQLACAHLTQPTQANGVFVCFPKKMIARLREQAFFYVWDENPVGFEGQFECRLMTSWDTTSDDIDGFLTTCANVAREFTETNLDLN